MAADDCPRNAYPLLLDPVDVGAGGARAGTAGAVVDDAGVSTGLTPATDNGSGVGCGWYWGEGVANMEALGG